MISIEKEIKKLYRDAMFNHLMRKGYSEKEAETKVKSIFDN